VTVTDANGATASNNFVLAVTGFVSYGPINTTAANVTATLSVTGCSALDNVSFSNPPSAASTLFPFGVLGFTARSCAPGGSATVQIQFSRSIPANSQFYKCDYANCWYFPGAAIVGDTVTYTVTDGGAGDMDSVSGQITDPAGVGIPATPTIPTLNEWGMALLAGLLGVGALLRNRRRSA
jgi:hypothetical protein